MTTVWLFAARVAVAASYLTLALTHSDAAATVAGPYAAVVLCVAVVDLWTFRRRTHES